VTVRALRWSFAPSAASTGSGATGGRSASQCGSSRSSAAPRACSERCAAQAANEVVFGGSSTVSPRAQGLGRGPQVLEQDAPGDRVDHEVLGDEEEPRRPPVAELEPRGAQERPACEVERALELLGRGGERPRALGRGKARELVPLERHAGLEAGVGLRPAEGPRAKRSRRASWCATRWPSARSVRAASSPGGTSSISAWFQCCGSANSSSKNQCWIGVSGAAPETGPCSATETSTVPAQVASSAIVGCSKT
jgi:hypothetical protein